MRKRLVYAILGLIPIAFGLFLLTMVNVLYALLAIVVLLGIALKLKRKKPEWFAMFRRKKDGNVQQGLPKTLPSSEHEPPQVVYLVLSAQNQYNMQRIPINKVRFSIGREQDNDYVIDDQHISRHHLRIEYDKQARIASAIDLNSKYYSYLNGDRMEPNRRYTLTQGDQLMIYDYVFLIDMASYG